MHSRHSTVKNWDERVATILTLVKGPTLLHVGCVGGGVPDVPDKERHHLHFQLCEALPEAEIVGIDVNGDGIREMKSKGLNVLQMDAEEMAFEGSFDTIVAGELIEHLCNPGRFLEGCRWTLKPGGRVVLTTPNPFSLMYFLMYAKNFKSAFNPGHSLWFCPQTLSQTARRAGFSVTELRFVDSLCPELVPSGWYKSFALCWKFLRPLLPKRFRNTIVAVLEPA